MSYKRITTAKGPIHVWSPPGASRRRGGMVVYVHGFFNTADQAVEKHKLIEQFANSGIDATFIVPEAPWKKGQEIFFPDLRALLQTVDAEVGLPQGAVTVIGHSAAHGTLRHWLDAPFVQHVILLDALYGDRSDFEEWARDSSKRLTVIGRATNDESKTLVRSLGGRYLDSVPSELPKERVIGAKSQWGHHAIVEDGIVIPIVLRHTGLPRVGSSWLPWVAGLLAIGAAGFGGWYYWSRRQRSSAITRST